MFSGMLAKLGMDIEGMNGVMGMATASAIGLGAGVAAIGGISAKLATDFDQQMARISGLTGSSAQEIDYYRQKILELSPTWDMSATDAAKSLYFVISAGFRSSQAIDVLNYSAKSATASLADQATVADTLTSMMNAYKDANVSAKEAANDLTKIEVYGKAQLQSFAGSLGFTMTTAHAAGISISEASAAIANLSYITGNHGIRRISMEFDNLARSMLDINAIEKRAKGQHLNFDKAAFSTMTFIEKLQYLQKITGALSSNINDQTYSQMKNMDATTNQLEATKKLDLALDQNNSAFMKLTGGAAAFIPAAILVSGHAQTFTDILGHMADKADVVQSAFDNMRNTTAQRMKMFEISLQNAGIVIGLQILPAINKLLAVVLDLSRGMMTFISTKDGMETLKYSVIGLAVIAFPLLAGAIWSAVAPLIPWLVTTTAMIAAAIWLGNVIKTHPEILKALQRLWTDLTKLFDDATRALGGDTGKGTVGAAKQNTDALKVLGDAVAGALVHLIDFLDFIVTHQWVLDGLKIILLAIGVAFALNLAEGIAGTVVALPGLIAGLYGTATAATVADIALGPLLIVVLALAVAIFGLTYWNERLTESMQGNFIDFSTYRQHMQDTTVAIEDMTTAQAKANLTLNQSHETKLEQAINQEQKNVATAPTAYSKDVAQQWVDYGKNLELQNQMKILADKARIKDTQQSDQDALALQQIHHAQMTQVVKAHNAQQIQQDAVTTAARTAFLRKQHLDAEAVLKQHHVTVYAMTLQANAQAAEDERVAAANARAKAHAYQGESIADIAQFDEVTQGAQILHHLLMEKDATAHYQRTQAITQTAHTTATLEQQLHANRAKALADAAAAKAKAATEKQHNDALAEARLHYAQMHGIAQWFYDLMHPAQQKANTTAKTTTATHHATIQQMWVQHHGLVATQTHVATTTMLNRHAADLTNAKAPITHAAKVGMHDPVKNQMDLLGTLMQQSGPNLMQMLAKGITDNAGLVDTAAQTSLKGISGWLGFRSPAPNVPESAYWGRNLGLMFASSLLSAQAEIDAAGKHLLTTVQNGLAGPVNGGTPSLVGAGSGTLVGGGGGNVTHIHNWTGAFPNVKTSDEVITAVRKIQDEDYRLGRRAGSGGTRAIIGS